MSLRTSLEWCLPLTDPSFYPHDTFGRLGASRPRYTQAPSLKHANAANGGGRVSKYPQMSDDLLESGSSGRAGADHTAEIIPQAHMLGWRRQCFHMSGSRPMDVCQGFVVPVFSSSVSFDISSTSTSTSFSTTSTPHTPCPNHSRLATLRRTTRLTTSSSSSIRMCMI